MPKRSKAYMEGQRRRFCDAAMACFQRKGVTASNLTDICEEAGLSMGALYKHFDSRDQLLEAVFQLRLTERNELLQGETWIQLRDAILEYREQLEHSRFWRELQGVVDWNDRLMDLRVSEGRTILTQLERQLARYAAAGEIEPPFDLPRTAQLVSVIFEGSTAAIRSSPALSIRHEDFIGYLDLAVGHRDRSKRS